MSSGPIPLPGLSLAERPALFKELAGIDAAPGMTAAVFGEAAGWVVSDYEVGHQILTSSVGSKSRPARSQALLGGVGALSDQAVRTTKRQLIRALGLAADSPRLAEDHLRATLAGRSLQLSDLTEVFAAGLLAHVAGAAPGAIDGRELRSLILGSWRRLEHPETAAPGVGDELFSFIHDLVRSRSSPSLAYLREEGWSDEHTAEEFRAMLLAGWGSTTAAAVSAIALEAPIHESFGLQEVLRLFPPSFMIARRIEATNSAYPFAIGDIVLVSPWLIHRSEREWPDANQFDPTRWRQPGAKRAFLPFGVGPRRCPAARFARMQASVAAPILRERLTPSPSRMTMVEGRSPALVPATLLSVDDHPLTL